METCGVLVKGSPHPDDSENRSHLVAVSDATPGAGSTEKSERATAIANSRCNGLRVDSWLLCVPVNCHLHWPQPPA